MALYPRQNSTFAFNVRILCSLSAICHQSVAMRHRTCHIRVSQCGFEVWKYGDFPCDIPITHFQFHRFHAYYIQHVQLSFYARLSFFRHFMLVSLFTSLHAWMINRSNTLYFEGPIQYGEDWVSSSSQRSKSDDNNPKKHYRSTRNRWTHKDSSTLFARWLTLKTTLKRKKLSACLVKSATYELTSAARKINEGLLIGRYKSQVTGHCFGLFQYW